MKNKSRRDFIKSGTITTIGMGILPFSSISMNGKEETVKIGVIGTGTRGTSHVKILTQIPDNEIIAVCDIDQSKAENAASLCQKEGKIKPKIYSLYKEMLDNEELDAVIIATPWNSHTEISLYAMRNGVYPGCELPIALTVEDNWKLVEMSEKTGIPCMMLENWSFRQDNLALLNMKRLGMFGDIVHCHCAHSHDVNSWYESKEWPQEYLLKYNRDQYPCHSVGPILSWMDINCGDIFTEIYSTASASTGINDYYKRKYGEDHPKARLNYSQGDIVTSTLKTELGKTLVINMDMQLPRPYSNRWLLQGKKGVYDEEKGSIYLNGISPEKHQWEPWNPYQEKYNHKWWQIEADGGNDYFHGGVDYVMMVQFINAVRVKGPVPLDVYDSVVMSAIVELSGISIQKNKPIPFPDFTKGEWKNRRPYFGLDKTL
jgi:predicted dehydrogenase